MGNILGGVKMSDPVKSPTSPKTQAPSMEAARNAVVEFFQKMPDVRRVDVTKVAVLDAEKGTLEAEAEVYVPNAAIKSLGLPVQREVLDCKPYLLRLDEQLTIVGYGLKDSVEE